jgi:hypothetical protein
LLSVNWDLFLYRLPTEPSRARVAVWRELRKLGALPLAQSVSAVPVSEPFVSALDGIEARVGLENGTSYRFRLNPTPEQQAQLEAEWNALRSHEYAEIVEECETKFLKEIEFELFRGNVTASEAEEIEADLDKIKRWAARVEERDLFQAVGSDRVRAAIKASQAAFDDFLERAYQAEQRLGPQLDRPEDIPWGEVPTGGRPRRIADPRAQTSTAQKAKQKR